MTEHLTQQEQHQAIELSELWRLMDQDPRLVSRDDAARVPALANNGRVRMKALELLGVRKRKG